MKIRIKGNSIRYRLTQSEVDEFCIKGYFEEKTTFEDAQFTYAVKMDESAAELTANLNANTITLNVPKNIAADWHAQEKIGFDHTVSLQSGEKLHLLLEKDFTCMDERAEDESDNYPNPKMVDLPSSQQDK